MKVFQVTHWLCIWRTTCTTTDRLVALYSTGDVNGVSVIVVMSSARLLLSLPRASIFSASLRLVFLSGEELGED